MSAAAERSLFATKGRAAPGGSKTSTAPDAAPRAAPPDGGGSGPMPGPDRARIEAPIQATLPLSDASDREPTSDAALETHPAGSLLTFRLRGASGRLALIDEIKSALSDPVPAIAEPAEAPTPPPAPPPAPAARVALPNDSELVPVPAPVTPEMPFPADSSSMRLDRPLFPRPSLPHEEAAPARGVPSPAYVAPRPSAARTVLPAAIAVLAVAVVGWLIADSDSPTSTAIPDAVEQPAPPESGANLEAAPTEAPADPVPAPLLPAAAPEPESSAALVAPAASVATSAGDTPSTKLPAAETPESVLPIAGPTAPPAAVDAPILDVVRVEPDAPPVLAGRAAPGSELIVLDNGTPIGTVIADVNGEWALVSDAPLPSGRHEFSLALKAPDGEVMVEQADADSSSDVALGADGLLVPPQKPVPGDPSAALAARLYVIQLASVPSVADAEREWARLQEAHPAQLGGRTVEVNSAEVGDRGTFYRVRTGPFADREAARQLCREMNAAGQECLVVRATSAD